MINDQQAREPLPYGKPSKSFDIKGFLKRYGLLLLVIGSFLFTITVPIVLLIGKPNYEVKALMRIDPVIPSLITKSDDPSIINYYQDYARTQAKRMVEFSVLKKTVEKLTPDEKAAVLPATLPADKCATILGFIIKVTPVNGTHLIEISASSPKKEGLAPLVNNFMEVFLEKVRNNTEMQDKERLTYLSKKKQALTNEISAIENNLDTLTKSIYTASYSEEYNLASKNNEELQRLYVRLFGDRVIAENQNMATENANKQIKSLKLEPMVEEIVMNDQSLDFTSSWTYQQLQQLRSSTDGLTANNPDRIYVEQRMKAMQNYENKLQDEIRKSARTILYGKRDHDLQKESIIAKNNFEKAKKTEEEILDAFNKNKDEAVRISLGMHLGQSLEFRLKHNRELLDRIDTRIHELEVEGKAPLRISIESAAREPDNPAGSNIKQLLLIFLIVSFGSTGGIFLAYDFFDNRIRRPEDIRNAFGYTPAGIIPVGNPETPFSRILTLDPAHKASKALRSLAVKLQCEKEEHNASLILFTAADNGAGCTTIALNTAQALSALVPKVLFIEANTANPAIAGLTGVPASPGLCDILSSALPWKTAITRAPGFSMDIIIAGTIPEGCIAQQRIQNILEEAKHEYDFICIDSAPVTESDLTENLAINTDIIALVAQANSTFYRDLRTSAELLVRLGVPAIAPILNHGGRVRSLSIDKLLEKQPEFLNNINTVKIEKFLNELPPATELFRKTIEGIRKTGTFLQKIPKNIRKVVPAKKTRTSSTKQKK